MNTNIFFKFHAILVEILSKRHLIHALKDVALPWAPYKGARVETFAEPRFGQNLSTKGKDLLS